MNQIKVTVLMENAFWVGIFEREEILGYATTRHVFGKEPTDPELYQFVSEHFYELNFTEPQKEIKLIIKRKNFKRMTREVRKEMSAVGGVKMTRSQEVLKDELEKNKKERKTLSAKQKQLEKDRQFQLKQEKKKERYCLSGSQ